VLARQARETEAINAVSNLVAADRNGVNTAFFKAGNGNAPAALPLTLDNLDAVLGAMAAKKSAVSGRSSPRPTWSWWSRRRWSGRSSGSSRSARSARPTAVGEQLEYDNYVNVDYVVEPMLDYWNTGTQGGHHLVHRAEAGLRCGRRCGPRSCVATRSPDLRVKANTGQRVGGGDISPLEGSFEADDIQYRGRHVLGTRWATRRSPTCRTGPDPPADPSGGASRVLGLRLAPPDTTTPEEEAPWPTPTTSPPTRQGPAPPQRHRPTPGVQRRRDRAFLALEGDVVKLAAAQAIDVNADDEALTSKVIRTQDLTTDGAKLADSMRKHAAALREQAADEGRGLLRARRRLVLLLVGSGADRTPDLLALMRPQRAGTADPAPRSCPPAGAPPTLPWPPAPATPPGPCAAPPPTTAAAGTPTPGPPPPTPARRTPSHITARIQSLVTHRSDAQVVVAEDVVITASYLIAVDRDLEVIEGDAFTVETCPGDSDLVDRILRVEHVVLGTERFERDLFCNLLEPPPAED
jgi:hypothetical protein